MKKIALRTLIVIVTLVNAWFALSCVEVLTKNLSDNNFFAVIANERKSYGTYYADGTVVTIDGHIWDYHKTNLEDGTPVRVYFDDQNTDDITDDDITRLREYK